MRQSLRYYNIYHKEQTAGRATLVWSIDWLDDRLLLGGGNASGQGSVDDGVVRAAEAVDLRYFIAISKRLNLSVNYNYHKSNDKQSDSA